MAAARRHAGSANNKACTYSLEKEPRLKTRPLQSTLQRSPTPHAGQFRMIPSTGSDS